MSAASVMVVLIQVISQSDDGVSFDLRKSGLLARGFTAARWTCGRSARPPSLS